MCFYSNTFLFSPTSRHSSCIQSTGGPQSIFTWTRRLKTVTCNPQKLHIIGVAKKQPPLSRQTKPTRRVKRRTSYPSQVFSIQHSSTSEASIWPAGVKRIEWRHGCAGEVWQHCFTLTGVINSEAIKTRWRAAEVTLTLSQPQRAQLCQERDLSIAVNLLSCVILRDNQNYILIINIII